jgi:hypothetical protein
MPPQPRNRRDARAQLLAPARSGVMLGAHSNRVDHTGGDHDPLPAKAGPVDPTVRMRPKL